MNFSKNKWFYLKIILLAICLLPSRNMLKPIEGGPVPFWVYPIPIIFFALFLPFYLRVFTSTERSIYQLWHEFPFSFFHNPAPFYHLAGWACFLSGVINLFLFIFVKSPKDATVPIMGISMGTGALIGVWITRKIIESSKQKMASTSNSALENEKNKVEH